MSNLLSVGRNMKIIIIKFIPKFDARLISFRFTWVGPEVDNISQATRALLGKHISAYINEIFFFWTEHGVRSLSLPPSCDVSSQMTRGLYYKALNCESKYIVWMKHRFSGWFFIFEDLIIWRKGKFYGTRFSTKNFYFRVDINE